MSDSTEPNVKPRRVEDGTRDFAVLTAASADLGTVASVEGVYRYVSPASQRLFGWNPEELQGHRLEEFVHSDDIPTLHAARAHAPPDETFTTTYRFRCADGSYRWTEANFRNVEAWGSEFVVSTVREITE